MPAPQLPRRRPDEQSRHLHRAAETPFELRPQRTAGLGRRASGGCEGVGAEGAGACVVDEAAGTDGGVR